MLNYVAGWFLGLSKSFLEVRTARLLVLAGTDRLDKDLMLGQMMGKFQLVVIPGTGHMIQEVKMYPSPHCLVATANCSQGRSIEARGDTDRVLEAQRASHSGRQEGRGIVVTFRKCYGLYKCKL